MRFVECVPHEAPCGLAGSTADEREIYCSVNALYGVTAAKPNLVEESAKT